MQLPTTITRLIAAAAAGAGTSCVSAAPATNAPLQSRAVGGILICEGANATGMCFHSTYSLEECHDVPGDLQRNAATFAPDGDGFYCYPRAGNCSQICTSPTGCTFGAVDFYNPRKWDLSAIGWEHLIGSFTCHLNETTTTTTTEAD